MTPEDIKKMESRQRAKRDVEMGRHSLDTLYNPDVVEKAKGYPSIKNGAGAFYGFVAFAGLAVLVAGFKYVADGYSSIKNFFETPNETSLYMLEEDTPVKRKDGWLPFTIKVGTCVHVFDKNNDPSGHNRREQKTNRDAAIQAARQERARQMTNPGTTAPQTDSGLQSSWVKVALVANGDAEIHAQVISSALGGKVDRGRCKVIN